MAVSLKLNNETQESDKPKQAFLVLIYPCLQAFDFDLNSYKEFSYDRNKYSVLSRNIMIVFYSLYAFGNYNYFKAFADNKHVTSEMKKKYRNRVNPRLLQGRYRTEPSDDIEANDISFAKEVTRFIFDTRFAPLMASDEQLSKLPPTFVLTCEFDPLRDESFILNERLKSIKHPITHLHLSGSEHGALLPPFYRVSKTSIETISQYIRTHLESL